MLGQTILWDEVNRRKALPDLVISVPRLLSAKRICVLTDGVRDQSICVDVEAGSAYSRDYRVLLETGSSPLVSIARNPWSHL